jgi:hypothetical protein
MISRVAIVMLLMALSCGVGHAGPDSGGGAPAVPPMTTLLSDPGYNFEALRTMGAASGGGADIGECLETFSRIHHVVTDDESWYRAWRDTAERLERAARSFADARSAAECFGRASNYYRAAEFYLREKAGDPRADEVYQASRRCFRAFARRHHAPIRAVRIPYEGTTLPGYLCLVDDRPVRRPLLLLQTGFDGTAEELYFHIGHAAVSRGYNCLIFEGPGQGAAVRLQHLYFRPDWEKVVTPVVDYAIKLAVVDPKKIALMGVSFGGYLAPRAVAFEPRIAACVANGGVYEFHVAFLDRLPPPGPELDALCAKIMAKNTTLRWFLHQGMWTMHVPTPSAFITELRRYTLAGCVDRIRCKMLVVDSEDDEQMSAQATRLFDALHHCPKTFLRFMRKEAAGEHCQVGAFMISNERIFAWLDEALALRKAGRHQSAASCIAGPPSSHVEVRLGARPRGGR